MICCEGMPEYGQNRKVELKYFVPFANPSSPLSVLNIFGFDKTAIALLLI